MNDVLMQLADAAGIEGGYWDGLGMRRDLHEQTAVALLAALGLAPGNTADTQYQALADAAFMTPLPPCVVVTAGGTAHVMLALPRIHLDTTIAWRITLETGEEHDGAFALSQSTPVEEREIGGNQYVRFTLPIPADIPVGYHELCVPSHDCATLLIVAPARCFIPETLAQGGKCWGLAVQLYALRSSHNWGIGDFGDLSALATAAGRAGAAFIGLNPLHARHIACPNETSPYAPSSRLFLDPLYIDVESVEGYATSPEVQSAIAHPDFRKQLADARNEPLVNYASVTALKLRVLHRLFRHFQHVVASLNASLASDYHEFKLRGGAALARFAEFEALRLYLTETTGRICAWHDWPSEFHDPMGAALVRFRGESADRIEFQIYLQWLAATQLRRAELAARAAGMPIGLYCDLAVGAAHDSAETWSEQQLFAHDVSVGAPPDMLNRQGQSWGLPPWKPRALVRQRYAPLRALLAANMRNAGALRIDHVMALARLFWIPKGLSGADGGYVRNPFDELAAIVALESVRNRCMVIGEDLGSVPDGLRDSLRDRGFLSYRVLVYERHWQSDGRFCLPDEYPPQSLATVATHDMPTVTEYWHGGDIARRAQLGMHPGIQQQEEEAARRHGERAGILRLLGELGLSPAHPETAAAVVESLHEAIARTRSMLAVVQLDDLLGETEPVNIPGTYREYPNWRRKLALSIEEIAGDERWARLTTSMRRAGRGASISAGGLAYPG